MLCIQIFSLKQLQSESSVQLEQKVEGSLLFSFDQGKELRKMEKLLSEANSKLSNLESSYAALNQEKEKGIRLEKELNIAKSESEKFVKTNQQLQSSLKSAEDSRSLLQEKA